MPSDAGSVYIRENFAPTDRLAVVLLNKQTKAVIQRVGTSERIASPEFQSWLRHMNAARHEVYISMNTLKEGARGRTKDDVATIRNIYLDFDENGTAAVQKLLEREDLPTPNYLINSSPDKWQVVWNVEGFEKDQAEQLQRALVRETGADPAATDSSRVLRLPGFYNHKYSPSHYVRAENRSSDIYSPDRFPRPVQDGRSARITRTVGRNPDLPVSQSERDWAYACRALSRGDEPHAVAAAIAAYRTDKHNPQYYAELTVQKATEALRAQAPADESVER
jgi:hypothetical protein